MNTRAIGTKYEEVARKYLIKKGYKIVTSNFRAKFGEIDIIAKDGIYLCFIEVKFRGKGALSSGLEAVDKKKQKTIYKVAELFMMKNNIDRNSPCRFDVISIDYIDKASDFSNQNEYDVTLIKNAFP